MKKMKFYIKRVFVVAFYYVFRVFPVDKNKVFVSNYCGKGYGDNPKYIVNELLKEKMPCDIVWVLKKGFDKSSIPKGIRIVKRNTIKYIFEQVTARVWIDNCRKQFYERKRKGQYYIHTWHGSFPTKRIEGAVESHLDEEYVLSAKNDSKMANVILSSSEFMTKIVKRDFWYDGEVFECGSPRNDIIVKKDAKIREKVFAYYELNNSYRVCLYAPTFRRDFSLDSYNLNYSLLKKVLEKKYGGEWKILIRLHPNISEKSKGLINYNADYIDASKYDDMQELLVASDFMITDYSSCIFDYALTHERCCIFASDIKDYNEDRGFYINMNEWPFEIATTNNELVQIIENFDDRKNKRAIKDFFKHYGSVEDGNGAKTVAKLIKKKTSTSKKSDSCKMKKENKVLLFNTIMMYVMMASTFVFPLITLPYLTRVLGTASYGIVVLANAVMQYFQLFIDYGFILSGTAICSKERDNRERLQIITSSIIHSKLLLSLVGLAVVFILAFSLEMFKGFEWFIVCSYLPLMLTSFIPDYLFRGIEKMGTITFRTIVAKLVYTALIFLLVRDEGGYYYIPLSLFISNLIIVMWSWVYIKKELKMKMVRVKLSEVKAQLKASSTFFASRIATTVYSASNVFVLGLYGFSETELGIYGAANTLINYGKSMFSPIADSLYPYMIKNKNHRLVRKVILILCPIIVIGCTILFLISDFVIAVMAGKEYMESVPIFRCMIPMLIITLPEYLYGFPMLGSIGRNDKANQSVLIGAIFHFTGLVILVVTRLLNFYSIILLTTITETLILGIRVYCFNKYRKSLLKNN